MRGVHRLRAPQHPTSGDLCVCEDGPGTDALRVVTPEGFAFPFARVALSPQDPRHAGGPGIADTAGEVPGSPPGWLPPLREDIHGRGAEYGYRPTETAALRALGVAF